MQRDALTIVATLHKENAFALSHKLPNGVRDVSCNNQKVTTMNSNSENRNKFINNKWLFIWGLLCVQFMLGCSNHYGRLAVSGEAKAQFENYQILPDHRYYYSGPDARPRAAIGIHEDYTLESKFWIPIDLTSNQLKKWVNYRGPNSKYWQGANGSDILSDTGEKIGIWYAFRNWRDWARIEMIDEKVVNISTPIEHKSKARMKCCDISTHD